MAEVENGAAGLFEKIKLNEFSLKQVINGHPDRKAIFLLLERNGESAILICDKHAFEEDGQSVSAWLGKSELQFVQHNDRYGNFEMTIPAEYNQVKVTLIYPATEFDIQKYGRQEHFMVCETPEDYQNITLRHLEDTDYKKQLKWVYNLLDKKSEAERIVFEDEDRHTGFILAPDLKWNGVIADELYFLAVAHRRDLRSVRDLTPDELPLLENIRDKSAKLVKDKYGLDRNKLKMYFHYQPTFYHLHVHIVSLRNDAPGWGGTSILLDSVIENLKMCPDFYKKATLPFIAKELQPLYRKYVDAGRV